MTETEDPLLNGQLVPPLPFPNCKYGLWMVTVLNKAEWRPRRRAPPQVSPGTFLSSCHWIRACLWGYATGGLPRWRVSHQSSPADLLTAGLNMADASVIAPSRPTNPIAFFPLCAFSSNYRVSISRPAIGGDVVLINAKKRRRRESASSPLLLAPPWVPLRIYGRNKHGQRLNLTFNSLGSSASCLPSLPSRQYLVSQCFSPVF